MQFAFPGFTGRDHKLIDEDILSSEGNLTESLQAAEAVAGADIGGMLEYQGILFAENPEIDDAQGITQGGICLVGIEYGHMLDGVLVRRGYNA